MKALRTAAIGTSLVLVLFSTTGCRRISEMLAEKAAEKAVEESSGAKDVKLRPDGVRFEGKDGEKVAIGADTKLPDGWPSYAPLYPGAKLTIAIASPGQAAKTISMETTDDADKVSAFYKEKLTQAGWKAGASMNVGGAQTTTYQKPKVLGSIANVMVTAGQGAKTMASISITEKT